MAGGAAGEVHCSKIADMMSMSLKTGSPFIFINDSGGARVQEGIDSLAGYARVFYNNVMLSGTVPQISIICGPCAGGAAYSPALTDFIIQTQQARRCSLPGPGHQAGDRRRRERRELGGPQSQMNASGVVHLVARGRCRSAGLVPAPAEFSALQQSRRTAAHAVQLRRSKSDPEMNAVAAGGSQGRLRRARDHQRVLDYQDFFEIQPGFAPNVVIGFGRLQGRPVGIIANQPSVLAGVLDIDASDKAARFVRFCNAFNIPLLTFVDVPGFLPGVEQEYGGIIRHGAKMLFAYSAATVPKITVVLRKAYGGAYIAMCCKDLGADRVVAWPTAEIAVMGAEGAAEIVFRREIDAAQDKSAQPEGTDRALSRDVRQSVCGRGPPAGG